MAMSGFTPWRRRGDLPIVTPMKSKTLNLDTTHLTGLRASNIFTGLAVALCAAVLIAPQGMAASKDTLNAADVKFIKVEAAAGMAVVKLAELGVKKAASPEVKAFAETLVTDHTAANMELKQLAKDKGVELSAVIDPKAAETFQDLEKANGSDFDKAFLAVAISNHKDCISNFETSSKEAKDSDLKMWVDKMTPALKTHLAKAEELHSK